jgi:hypothetical protein
MTWMVQLAGDTSDLSALAQSLTGADINISHDSQDYVLTSDRFEPDDDAAAVKEKAEDMVMFLNAGCRLALEATQSIRVTGVYRWHDDGRRDIFLFPEPLVVRLRVFAPTLTVTHANGTIEESHPADPVKQWTSLALSNEAVANVFRILSSGALDWINLYRIFEIIGGDVGGVDGIASNGWAAKTSMKLFKRTANSPGALGLNARHGAERAQPAPKPMSISEARTLINLITHAWLRAKTGG